MQRYEKYKDCGVDWIREIPEHWKVRRLGNLLTDYSEKNNSGFPLISITREKGVILRDLENDKNHNFIPDDLSGYKKLYINCFGMNKMKAWQGSYGISKYTGIVSPAYYTFKISDHLHPDFFHFAIRSKIYISFFGSASDGVRIGQWDLSKTRMKNIPFIIPSIPEQQAIASFLDDKTSKIDQTISIKEKEIELLKERCQILIQKAVTKGLDDHVKMKDSGVEWIGEIPEHWEVKKLKYVFNLIKTGTTPSTANQEYFDGEINWFNPKDLNEEILSEAEKKITELAILRKEIKIFPGDSILIVGIGATSGKTAYLTNNSTFNQQITGFHSKKENNKFFFYFFKCTTTLMLNLANYTTLPILNNEFFKSFTMVLPSLIEQTQIVSYLEKVEEKISKAISLKEQEIEKLKEYKTVLIDNVVTGKVKVS